MLETRDDLRSPQGVGRLSWTEHSADGVTMVRLADDLDILTASQFERRLRQIVDVSIVLDLSAVTFIDAHCTGLIVRAWDAANTRGHELRVVGLHGVSARVFEVLAPAEILGQDTSLERAS